MKNLGLAALLAASCMTLAACDPPDDGPKTKTGDAPAPATGSASYDAIIKARDLKPDDVEAALKTFTPSGRLDEYVMIASGGHSGQLFAIGIPSMRILKTIGVFSPESWQGYGTGSKPQEEMLDAGNSWGSMTTASVGPAVRMAAEDARGQLLAAAAEVMGESLAELGAMDGVVTHALRWTYDAGADPLPFWQQQPTSSCAT